MNSDDSANQGHRAEPRPAGPPGQPALGEPAPREPVSTRTIRSADLFQGAREILIQHDEENVYRLRLTRNGKLILVK